MSDALPLIGRTIAGKFLVEAVVSTGGAGTVYRARQVALDRVVALKVLRDEVAQEEDFIERFRREARAASRLDHPNSVRVLDFGQDGESLFYLAMEYVEGRTLHELIREEWPLDDRRIVDIMSQVLSALAVAHDMNVVHRDLKPDNVIIIRSRTDEGELREVAKVCDFGIASLGAAVGDGGTAGPDAPHVTLRGFLVGTPEFMSPEQARGAPADRRSDIYAAGLVLYEMLTRRLPFEGDNPYAIVVKHVTETPPAPSRFATVNPQLEAICLKAISKDPRDRYANAREMRVALRALFPSSAAGETPDATPLPALPSRGRRWLVVGGVAVAAALAVGGVVMSRGGVAPAKEIAAAPVAAEPPPGPSPRTAGRGAPEAARDVSRGPEAEAAAAAAEPAAPRTAVAARRRAKPAHATLSTEQAAPAAAPATPPVIVAAPPVAAAAPAKAQPAPALDPELARVSITAVTTTNAVPAASIRAALARVPLARCYREALRAGSAAAGGTATLRLHVDMAGYVTDASLQDAQFLPGMKGCIEQAARVARVRDVDTGEGTADVTLSFVPR